MRRISLILISMLWVNLAMSQTNARQHAYSFFPHKEGISLGYGFSFGNHKWQLKSTQTIRFTNPDRLSNTYSTVNGFNKDVVDLKEYVLRTHFRYGNFNSERTVTPFFSIGPQFSSITFTRIPSNEFSPFFNPFIPINPNSRKRFYAYRLGGEVMGGIIIGNPQGMYLGLSGGLRYQSVTGTVENMLYFDNVELTLLNPYESGVQFATQFEIGYRIFSKKEARSTRTSAH